MAMTVRHPAVSGQFYPASGIALKRYLKDLLNTVPRQELKGRLRGLIVPHAGYPYSGLVAAYAYKLLAKAQATQKIAHLVLTGPAHTAYLEGIAADSHSAWQTPLGLAPVRSNGFRQDHRYHDDEHCLEVQLPFIQTIAPQCDLIPLLVGSIQDYNSAAKHIAGVLDDHAILIISTDLSHYLPYDQAVKRDQTSIEAILSLDPRQFERKGDACGKNSVLLGMEIARALGWSIQLLHYANSGDSGGDHSAVVGYASFAMTREHPESLQ